MTQKNRAEVIAASRHPEWPLVQDLITLRLLIPTTVLAQFNTHRMISKNAGSMRAIPTARVIRAVLADPEFPPELGANRPGMQSAEPIKWPKAASAVLKVALWTAVGLAWLLGRLGGHKQWVNRLLTPFSTTVVVATATRTWWTAFLALRDHPEADPSIRQVAEAVAAALEGCPVNAVGFGEFEGHMPFSVQGDDFNPQQSTARCARTSLATFDRPDRESTCLEDEALFKKLTEADPPHMSPTEHQAFAQPRNGDPNNLYGKNFGSGWIQYRSLLEGLVDPIQMVNLPE